MVVPLFEEGTVAGPAWALPALPAAALAGAAGAAGAAGVEAAAAS